MYIKKRWDIKTRLLYARKVEAYMAINNLNVDKTVRNIGISRDVYYRLMGGKTKTINTESQEIIKAFFDNTEFEYL